MYNAIYSVLGLVASRLMSPARLGAYRTDQSYDQAEEETPRSGDAL